MMTRINFDRFFTTFHRIFFESGTWTVSYTDMLIRLFPPKFWSDVAIFIAATSALAISTADSNSVKSGENDLGGLKESV